MSDGDSFSQAVIDQVKDLGSETVKSTANTLSPTNVIKQVVGQVIGKNLTAEDEAKKRSQDIATTQRVREIEAEMQQIRAENEKLTGPEIPGSENSTNTNEDLTQLSQQPVNIALKRAQTKMESDKATKG